MRLLLSIMVLAACSEETVVTDSPSQPAPAPKPAVDTPAVQQGYLGVLTPRESHDVVAPFQSTLVELKVKLGDRVKAKQVIARFDDRAMQKDYAAETATLVRKGTEIRQKKVGLDGARQELEHAKQALSGGVGTPADVERAETRVHDAEAQLAGANAALEEQHQKVEKLKQKLDEATVLAPADGKVLLPLHHEGELIQDGQVILQIISSDDLYLRFAIPGDQAGTIATKDEVDVLVVQPNITTKAIVRNVLPQLDPVAQMIIADADLVGPTDKLQGGQRCRILPRPKK